MARLSHAAGHGSRLNFNYRAELTTASIQPATWHFGRFKLYQRLHAAPRYETPSKFTLQGYRARTALDTETPTAQAVLSTTQDRVPGAIITNSSSPQTPPRGYPNPWSPPDSASSLREPSSGFLQSNKYSPCRPTALLRHLPPTRRPPRRAAMPPPGPATPPSSPAPGAAASL